MEFITLVQTLSVQRPFKEFFFFISGVTFNLYASAYLLIVCFGLFAPHKTNNIPFQNTKSKFSYENREDEKCKPS